MPEYSDLLANGQLDHLNEPFIEATQRHMQYDADQRWGASGGNVAAMGEAMGRGMTLVLSIWDDYSVDMRWLDSVFPEPERPVTADEPGRLRGPCDPASPQDPATLRGQYASAKAVFEDIRFGEIGSTYAAGATKTGRPDSTTTTVAPATTRPDSTAGASNGVSTDPAMPIWLIVLITAASAVTLTVALLWCLQIGSPSRERGRQTRRLGAAEMGEYWPAENHRVPLRHGC